LDAAPFVFFVYFCNPVLRAGRSERQKCFYRRQRRKQRFPLGNSKRDFVAFVFFRSICSGQNHSGNAVFENRLMKIDRQPDRNIE